MSGPVAAEPLVLLPGLLCDRRLFAPQLTALAAEREVLIPELTHDDSVAGMAARALAAAPSRFALAGLSMGGYVALEVVRQAPERSRVVTWNADENAHMLRINIALGFEPIALESSWTRR